MKQITSILPKECILCTTQEECDIIMDMMHDAGLKLIDGTSYKDRRSYKYLPEMCYYPYFGQYGSKKYYKSEGYTIYPASQFIEQSDFIEKEQASETKRHPKQGEKVLVKDYDLNEWQEAIFLCEIPQACAPYVCTSCHDESDYLEGKKVSVNTRKQIKQLPSEGSEAISTYTLELTEEQYKKVQDLINK